MKKLLLLPLVLVLGLSLLIVWFYISIKPVSNSKDYKGFLIIKGSSASQIGARLESARLIRSAVAFKIYTQFSGLAGKVPAGEFRLSPSYSLFQIVDALGKGPVEIWVTIPEGLRREEIAAKFASNLDKDQEFIDEFLKASKGVEGTLFPDTYLFPKEASASAIVNKMTRTFGAKASSFGTAPGLSFDQRVVLASLIERETKTTEERPIVAGILINRLNTGMPLQVDASIQYAIANAECQMTNNKCSDWWPVLSKSDLSVNSRFNTYKLAGLPPAPIANPGLSSLAAAFNPIQTDYFYYLHDPQGQIHYARTLEEHNANIRRFLGK